MTDIWDDIIYPGNTTSNAIKIAIKIIANKGNCDFLKENWYCEACPLHNKQCEDIPPTKKQVVTYCIQYLVQLLGEQQTKELLTKVLI